LSLPDDGGVLDQVEYSCTKIQASSGNSRSWQTVRAVPKGKKFSDGAYAHLKGILTIKRGSNEFSVALDHSVTGTIGNGSCGFHAALQSLQQSSNMLKSFPLLFSPGEPSDQFQLFQTRLGEILRCAADNDLQASGVRLLLCKYAIDIARTRGVKDPVRIWLLTQWNRPPCQQLYNDGFDNAIDPDPEKEVDTNFDDLDSATRVACQNAVSILSPDYYFDVVTAFLLHEYLLGIIAFVFIIDSGETKKQQNGQRRTNKGGRYFRFSHSSLADLVHPRDSVFWLPMFLREKMSSSSHYELLTPCDGSPTVQRISLSN
jgi:hypothetical protein